MDLGTSRRPLFKIEGIAIRIMYLFNTMDSFLILSSGLFLLFAYFFKIGIYIGVPFPTLVIIYIILYSVIRMADFHPLFLIFTPLYFYFIWRLNPSFVTDLLTVFIWMFVFTSFVQILLMGIPMSLAAGRIDIPFRMYLHSFMVLAPTTISLPLTLYYQLLLALSAKSLARYLYKDDSLFLVSLFLAGMAFTRIFMKKQFIPTVFHPAPAERYFARAIILNVDGLSFHVFNRARPPFLKKLEDNFTSVEGGAHTVYRALTNPAFASMLSGIPPQKHRVLNNNLGQFIRADALPDFINTRLYGSMHIRHFSRKEWKVTSISLVEFGFDKADKLLLEQVKQDMKKFNEVELWVIDLSQVDYVGHCWGTYSKEYEGSILKMDSLIEDFFKWLTVEKFIDDSLIIIASDHGMFITEHSFIISGQEERVPLIFIGNKIIRKKITQKVSILDIAANISYCLNKGYCKNSGGRAFPEMLKS
jgi:hypothetical protein